LIAVMSRATARALVTRPFSSRVGAMDRETSIGTPSLLSRMVSKCSIVAPRAMLVIVVSSSWRRSSGTRSDKGFPMMVCAG